MTTVTVDVRHSPFSHGQLYVALGRVRHRRGLYLLAPPDRCAPDGCPLAKNIVWPELLLPGDEARPVDSKARAHKPTISTAAAACGQRDLVHKTNIATAKQPAASSRKRRLDADIQRTPARKQRLTECATCGWRHPQTAVCPPRSDHADARSRGKGEHCRGTRPSMPPGFRPGAASGGEHNCLIDTLAKLLRPAWKAKRRRRARLVTCSL